MSKNAVKHDAIVALEASIRKLTLPQLNDLIESCEDIRRDMEIDARELMRKEIEKLAAKVGIDPRVYFQPAPVIGGKVPPKYRNPENPLETWSGRGRMPLWLAALSEADRALTLIPMAVAATSVTAPVVATQTAKAA